MTQDKVIKITSYGNHPMYVHAAYDRSGNVIRYFLLNYLHDAAPIDPEDVKDVMKIAKAEAVDRGFESVHASTMEYKPKNNGRYELRTGDSRHGRWEVAHHWADGTTVQVRYFATRKEAVAYLRSKGTTRK